MKSSTETRTGERHIASGVFRVFTLAFVLCLFAASVCGCSSMKHPGETTAETNRRHKRVLRLNRQGMLADIDRALMLDRPSKLTDKRIP